MYDRTALSSAAEKAYKEPVEDEKRWHAVGGRDAGVNGVETDEVGLRVELKVADSTPSAFTEKLVSYVSCVAEENESSSCARTPRSQRQTKREG